MVRKFIGLRIELLWLLAALAGFGILISLAPQPPHDFWWHLKIGEWIHTSGSIPSTNRFGWTLSSTTPYIYGAWLAEILFYAFYRLGELPLVLFTRTLLALAAFGLVGVEAYRRSHSWRIAGIVTALLCLMSANNLIVRPQNWAWLPFVVFLVLLGAYADGQIRGRWLWLCPLLMIFWVNVHGSFILGLVLVGIYLVGETLRTCFHLEGRRSWAEVAWIGGIGTCVLLAMLANPQGPGIFEYVRTILTDQPVQKLIVEWQPPDPRDLGSAFFFIGILILLGAFAWAKTRPTPSEVLSVLAFLWLAFSGVRNVVWFGMVAMPVLARSVKEWLPQQTAGAPARGNVLNLALAVLFFVPAVLLQPWWVNRLPLPEEYWSRVWKDSRAGPMVSVHTPVLGVEYLRQHPGGKLFNDMGYGSYLIWELPDQGVFVDPRVELYSYIQWLDYTRISNGFNYNPLLKKYGANRLFLDVESQAGLIDLLRDDSLWIKEYADPYTQVWRRAGENKY